MNVINSTYDFLNEFQSHCYTLWLLSSRIGGGMELFVKWLRLFTLSSLVGKDTNMISTESWVLPVHVLHFGPSWNSVKYYFIIYFSLLVIENISQSYEEGKLNHTNNLIITIKLDHRVITHKVKFFRKESLLKWKALKFLKTCCYEFAIFILPSLKILFTLSTYRNVDV